MPYSNVVKPVALPLQAGVARAEVKTQWIDYKQGDTELQGYPAYDDSISGKRPADRRDVAEAVIG
jgi:hypothetical protein